MAETIKGMSIPIDADSTEAQKSMKQLNAEIKTSAILADKYQKSLTFDDEGIVNLQKQFTNLKDEEDALIEKQKKLNQQMLEMEADGKKSTTAYKRLEIQLVSVQTQMKKVDDEQDRVNKDIKAMQTDNFDELSDKTKNANAEMKKLSKEMSNLNDEADSANMDSYTSQIASATSGTSAFSKVTELATLALNPYTLALAGATAGATLYWKRMQKTNEAQKAFTYNLQISEDNMKSFGKQASITGKSFGLEYADSLEIANQEMRIFGDEINNTADFNKYFAETLMLSQSELFDYDVALAEISANQANYNDDLQTTTEIMATQTVMLQKYGRSADDTMDTFIEFGDTMAALGLTSEQSLAMMNVGLVAGARNTDEVANAMNEFALRMNEADQATKDALTSIGLSYDALAQDIDVKGIQYGMLEVATAMNTFYVQTAETDGAFSALNQTMAIGMQLYGTYGEEFVSTFASNTDAVNGLNEAVEMTNAKTEALADITNQTLKPAYDDFAKNTLPDLGAEGARYNNILLNQGKLALVNALINEKKLVPAMQTLGLTIDSLPVKYQNMTTQLLILADSEATWNEKKSASNQLMLDETALALGNDEVMKARNDTYNTMAELQNRISDGYLLTTQGTQNLTEALYASNGTLTDYQLNMGSLNNEIANSIVYNSDYEVTTKEVEKAVTKLKDGTADYSFYLKMANTEQVQGVAAQILSNEQYERASQVLDQANKAYGGKGDTGYTGRFYEAIQMSDDGAKTLKTYNDRLETSKTDLDKMKSSLEKNTTKMGEFSTETEKAWKNLDHLNQSTVDYNNNPVGASSAGGNIQSAVIKERAPITNQAVKSTTFGNLIFNITAPDANSGAQIAELTGARVSQILADYAE